MCDCHPTRAETPPELRDLAEAAARVGGNLARQHFGHPLRVVLKADQSEVTDVDIAAEQAIIATIRAQRPADIFIGEESFTDALPADSAASDSIYWVIDPIDGTRNYIRTMPLFTCSVAAMRGGRPIAGAVFDPIQETMYSAAAGEGLLVNGQHQRLTAAVTKKPGEKLYIGIPSARREATNSLVFRAINEHVVRNFGSVAFHLALTAIGHLDATVVGNAKLWDIAAGCLLVSEGGGVVSTPAGEPLFPIVITNYVGDEIPLLAGDPLSYARLMQTNE